MYTIFKIKYNYFAIMSYLNSLYLACYVIKQQKSHIFNILTRETNLYLVLTWLFLRQVLIASVSITTPVLPTPALQCVSIGLRQPSVLFSIAWRFNASTWSRKAATVNILFKNIYKTPWWFFWGQSTNFGDNKRYKWLQIWQNFYIHFWCVLFIQQGLNH